MCQFGCKLPFHTFLDSNTLHFSWFLALQFDVFLHRKSHLHFMVNWRGLYCHLNGLFHHWLTLYGDYQITGYHSRIMQDHHTLTTCELMRNVRHSCLNCRYSIELYRGMSGVALSLSGASPPKFDMRSLLQHAAISGKLVALWI